MGNVLDHQLFRIGQTSVTVASLGAALILLVASWILSRLTHRLVVHRLLARSRLSLGLRHAIGRVAAYVVFFLGAVVGLQTIGINAGTLAAFGAAIGVGIGFGLQDIVKNFVSGLILLLERTVQVGDRIEVDGKAGDVAEIRGRATVVRTNDDVYLIVPNSRLIAETVVNHSFRRERESRSAWPTAPSRAGSRRPCSPPPSGSRASWRIRLRPSGFGPSATPPSSSSCSAGWITSFTGRGPSAAACTTGSTKNWRRETSRSRSRSAWFI